MAQKQAKKRMFMKSYGNILLLLSKNMDRALFPHETQILLKARLACQGGMFSKSEPSHRTISHCLYDHFKSGSTQCYK